MISNSASPFMGNGSDGDIVITGTVDIRDLYNNDNVTGVITWRGVDKGLYHGVDYQGNYAYNPIRNRYTNAAIGVINARSFIIQPGATLYTTTNFNPPSIYDYSDYYIIWIACKESFISYGSVICDGGVGTVAGLPGGGATSGLGGGNGGGGGGRESSTSSFSGYRGAAFENNAEYGPNQSANLPGGKGNSSHSGGGAGGDGGRTTGGGYYGALAGVGGASKQNYSGALETWDLFGAGGGGGGGGDASIYWRGGSGGGGGGGHIRIYCNYFDISNSIIFSANGGAGGAAGVSYGGSIPGAGGGGGGGGIIYIQSTAYVNIGINKMSAAGGAGGAGAPAQPNPPNLSGAAGNPGAPGKIIIKSTGVIGSTTTPVFTL